MTRNIVKRSKFSFSFLSLTFGTSYWLFIYVCEWKRSPEIALKLPTCAREKAMIMLSYFTSFRKKEMEVETSAAATTMRVYILRCDQFNVDVVDDIQWLS